MLDRVTDSQPVLVEAAACFRKGLCTLPSRFARVLQQALRWATLTGPLRLCVCVWQDKDKLRKEAAAKLKEAKAAMMALTESQLDTVRPPSSQRRSILGPPPATFPLGCP